MEHTGRLGRAHRDHTKRSAEEMGMEMVLITTKAMYKSRRTLPERSYDNAMHCCKHMLRRSLASAEVRLAIGADPIQWTDINDVFYRAIPALEVQSIPADGNVTATSGTVSSLMTLNYDILMKDLERLNDILLVARNCLATTHRAQNLAGESLLDQQILKLIDLCVRVTARGYDGEPGGRTEALWTNVVGAYKKLLITCLQFLHNFVMKNEQRKLLLWLDLFANSRIANEYATGTLPASLGRNHVQRDLGETPDQPEQTVSENADLSIYEVGTIAESKAPLLDKVVVNERDEGEGPSQSAEIGGATAIISNALESMSLLEVKADTDKGAEQMREDIPSDLDTLPSVANQDGLLFGAVKTERGDEFGALRTPESAAVTLQAAKDQLMARLADPSVGAEDSDGPEQPFSSTEEGRVEQNLPQNEEDDDDEKYPEAPGDQERGLLTDIPLVLGPQEIEALPMIVQIGICAGHGGVLEERNMQGMRCNILLAGEAGRNLLRELLIFIAAWDLQDEEVYFKLMMQIMEAILENGLMPYAYQSFAEVKDIVSPAQSMVIKLLTQIFRGKQDKQKDRTLEGISRSTKEDKRKDDRSRSNISRRVDIYIVRYIFTIFRSSIIPETCALIYLQGQIKAGAAHPDDFPLNLWDMERVYEGVYQFLEFFAVLTESEDWKELLVNWEIVSELVTLLRELDTSIPKAPITSGSLPQTVGEAQAMSQQQDSGRPRQSSTSGPSPVAVERPFEVNHARPADGPGEAQADARFSTDESGANVEHSDQASVESADPSDFEWRNLKKLVILVLSSLVWKSLRVQNQIRQYGGVQMVLSCCNADGNNPYIREHAIMCLRFVLEGNEDNKAIVRGLETIGQWEGVHPVDMGARGPGELGRARAQKEILGDAEIRAGDGEDEI